MVSLQGMPIAGSLTTVPRLKFGRLSGKNSCSLKVNMMERSRIYWTTWSAVSELARIVSGTGDSIATLNIAAACERLHRVMDG